MSKKSRRFADLMFSLVLRFNDNCEFQRLGDAADVVVVSVNYRLGPLGFMCLVSSGERNFRCFREARL